MTQRQAVFVGCRLIAIYFAFESAASVAGWLVSMGYAYTITGGAGGTSSFSYLQQVVIQYLARAGIAIFLWAAAGKIARIAADPEDGDDGR